MSSVTVEQAIWQALKSRLATLSDTWPVCWPEAADFVKPQDASGLPSPYIMAAHMPNPSRRFLIGEGAEDRSGVLLLVLNWPVAKRSSHEVMLQQAGLIAAHFPLGLRLNFGEVAPWIDRAPDIAAPTRSDAYIAWPIAVRWRCFA